MTRQPLPHIGGGERLVLIVGPSGAGKDSVMREWRARLGVEAPDVAQRVITRAPDASEAHEPVTNQEFESLQTTGRLATWWQAHGLHYGVRREQLEPLARGRWVVLNGSRAHLPILQEQAPGLRVVEINAPASVLAQRLATRAREHDDKRDLRLSRSVAVTSVPDLVLVNDGELRAVVEPLLRWWDALRTPP